MRLPYNPLVFIDSFYSIRYNSRIVQIFTDGDRNMIVTFKCSNCDTKIEIDQAQIGYTVECPICFTEQIIKTVSPPILEFVGGELEVLDEDELEISQTKSKASVKKASPSQSSRYLCVRFSGATGHNDSSPGSTLATQLQDILNKQDQQGWQFLRIDTVRVYLQPGCIASLLGVRTQQREYDIVIFERK